MGKKKRTSIVPRLVLQSACVAVVPVVSMGCSDDKSKSG
jgi:hypothetical protein